MGDAGLGFGIEPDLLQHGGHLRGHGQHGQAAPGLGHLLQVLPGQAQLEAVGEHGQGLHLRRRFPGGGRLGELHDKAAVVHPGLQGGHDARGGNALGQAFVDFGGEGCGREARDLQRVHRGQKVGGGGAVQTGIVGQGHQAAGGLGGPALVLEGLDKIVDRSVGRRRGGRGPGPRQGGQNPGRDEELTGAHGPQGWRRRWS